MHAFDFDPFEDVFDNNPNTGTIDIYDNLFLYSVRNNVL